MASAHPGRAVAGYLRKYPLAPRYQAGAGLTLSASDGVAIAAAALDGPAAAPATIVLVHGFVNSSRTPRIHRFAHQLAARMHVVVPDLRGHGRSGGVCTMGVHEPLDVEAAVAAARARHPQVPVVTMGTSLGGAAVLLHAGTFGGVAGVVAVSAPAWWGDFDSHGTRQLERWITGRMGRMVLANLLKTRIAAGCDPVPDARDAVGRIAPAFTLVVHDPDDWYFGADHGRRLHEWAGPPKALWWYPGGGHGTDLLTPAFGARVVAEIENRVGAAAGAVAPVRGC